MWCLLFKENTRICYLRGNYAPRISNVMLPALKQLADPRDIVLFNFGLWSNDMEELKMHAQMFSVAFDYNRGMLPARTFWRETTAQHYSTINGDPSLIITHDINLSHASAHRSSRINMVPCVMQGCLHVHSMLRGAVLLVQGCTTPTFRSRSRGASQSSLGRICRWRLTAA